MENETARRLYVLGHPISHSKSPVMYNAVYGQLDLPWHYGFMDLPAEEDAQAFLAARDFLSINITTPYKPHAFAAATVRDATAVLAKGANVLVNQGDSLVAYNTDGSGCVAYLRREGVSFAGARAVVCGTGPTSLSILHAVAAAGAAKVTLAGRNAERAQAVLDEYRAALEALAVQEAAARAGGVAECAGARECAVPAEADAAHFASRAAGTICREVAFAAGSYADVRADIEAADMVLDATSLGMKEGDPAPFDTTLLHAGQTAFDVVYGHGETAFVAGARAAGCQTLNGAGMLVGQAVVTAQIVLAAEGVRHDLSSNDLFAIMAQAAGFNI